jgi:hypothetical protein
MTDITQENNADVYEEVYCPHEDLAHERWHVLKACFYSMNEKCDECLEKSPQVDDICSNKTCPLFFVTQVFQN